MKILQVSCNLTFWSRDLTVGQMSDIAGLSPDASAERHATRWGARVDRDTAYWEISSRMTEGQPLDPTVSDMFARIEASKDALVTLRDRTDECQMSIAVHLNNALDDSFGLHLEVSQTALLAALRAGVDFEVYVEDVE